MLKNIFIIFLVFIYSFSSQTSFAADTTTPTPIPTSSFKPVADAPPSEYFNRLNDYTVGGVKVDALYDNFSKTIIQNEEAIGDIKQAERDAQTIYRTAIQNGKGEDVAKAQSYNILKAGSDRAVAKQTNGAGGSGGVLENFASLFGYTGTTNERLAKIAEADAAYAKSLTAAYNQTGDINKYGQADYNNNSANAYQDVANQARSGVFTVESSGIADIVVQKLTTPAAGGTYTLLAPIETFFPGGTVDVKGAGLGGYLNGLYKAGIAIATGLALIMIVVGGLEYVSTDSIQGKSNGKERIKNSIIGLLLALTSFIILQQINPNLLKSDLQVESTGSIGKIEKVDVKFTDGASKAAVGISSTGGGTATGAQATSFSGYASVRQLLNGLPGGSRSSDGSLIFTNYWNGDTNTNQQRGNNCNLLVAGSIALSPDLINKYKPAKGAGVLVNGLLVGYFDDTTSVTTGKVAINNTIDIYDPKKSLGEVLKKMPPGSWRLTFGAVRPQTPNPCPKK